MNLDQREIARYLGAHGVPLWPQAQAWAADCQRELEGTVTPRTLGRRLSLSLFQGRVGTWITTCATAPRGFYTP